MARHLAKIIRWQSGSYYGQALTDDGESVDFIVRADGFEQDNLFLRLGVSHELKDDAIFKVDRTSPRTGKVPFQFMSMKRRMKCIVREQF